MMIIFLLFAILHDFRVITVKMQEKIKYWENKLLDLGKKNKMIYCPAPKPGKRVSRASIMIQTPDIDKLWDKLVVNEGIIEFPIDLNAYVEGNEEDSEHLDAQTVFRNGYQTDQSVSEACKTLLSLKEKSKEFMDNKGLNALYLAMGFLKPEHPEYPENVFVCGDAASGASLVVRAMASGKEAAKKVDVAIKSQRN